MPKTSLFLALTTLRFIAGHRSSYKYEKRWYSGFKKKAAETLDEIAALETEKLRDDLRVYGVSFQKDGIRIEPRDVYEPPDNRPDKTGLDDGPPLSKSQIMAWKYPFILRAWKLGVSGRIIGEIFEVSHETVYSKMALIPREKDRLKRAENDDGRI